jgi:hypothetical protein
MTDRIGLAAIAGCIAVGSLAVAGCGGGSSSTTGASGASGASGSGTTATTYDINHVPRSAVIDSPAYFNVLLAVGKKTALLAAKKGKLSAPPQAIAHCVQNALLARGFKTQGDLRNANKLVLGQMVLSCASTGRSQ